LADGLPASSPRHIFIANALDHTRKASMKKARESVKIRGPLIHQANKCVVVTHLVDLDFLADFR